MNAKPLRLLASFSSPSDLKAALEALRDADIGPVETYTPAPTGLSHAPSSIGLVALATGLAGGAGAFAMQAYANAWAYPLDIGGRPKFSWPSFLPIAFEIGVLFAVVGIFLGVFIFGRLLRLYMPIDDGRVMCRSLSDRWILSTEIANRRELGEAALLCQSLGAEEIEEFSNAAELSSPVDAAAAGL